MINWRKARRLVHLLLEQDNVWRSLLVVALPTGEIAKLVYMRKLHGGGGSDVDERSSASVSSDLKALYKSVIIIIIIIIIIYR